MELSELTDKAIEYILDELKDSNSPKLTDWERNQFIPSVTDQWERKRWLSDRQKETLGRIWDKI
jgi:hypothetical protein